MDKPVLAARDVGAAVVAAESCGSFQRWREPARAASIDRRPKPKTTPLPSTRPPRCTLGSSRVEGPHIVSSTRWSDRPVRNSGWRVRLNSAALHMVGAFTSPSGASDGTLRMRRSVLAVGLAQVLLAMHLLQRPSKRLALRIACADLGTVRARFPHIRSAHRPHRNKRGCPGDRPAPAAISIAGVGDDCHGDRCNTQRHAEWRRTASLPSFRTRSPPAASTYEFVASESGTHWYHWHPSHQETEQQLPRNLFGARTALALPTSDYSIQFPASRAFTDFRSWFPSCS